MNHDKENTLASTNTESFFSKYGLSDASLDDIDVVDEAPTLYLEQFRAITILDFGTVESNVVISKSLVLRNTSSISRVITIEKFPSDKGFTVSWDEDEDYTCVCYVLLSCFTHYFYKIAIRILKECFLINKFF